MGSAVGAAGRASRTRTAAVLDRWRLTLSQRNIGSLHRTASQWTSSGAGRSSRRPCRRSRRRDRRRRGTARRWIAGWRTTTASRSSSSRASTSALDRSEVLGALRDDRREHHRVRDRGPQRRGRARGDRRRGCARRHLHDRGVTGRSRGAAARGGDRARRRSCPSRSPAAPTASTLSCGDSSSISASRTGSPSSTTRIRAGLMTPGRATPPLRLPIWRTADRALGPRLAGPISVAVDLLTVDTLQAALTYHRKRHTLLAGNIANLGTPGYRDPAQIAAISEGHVAASATRDVVPRSTTMARCRAATATRSHSNASCRRATPTACATRPRPIYRT